MSIEIHVYEDSLGGYAVVPVDDAANTTLVDLCRYLYCGCSVASLQQFIINVAYEMKVDADQLYDAVMKITKKNQY